MRISPCKQEAAVLEACRSGRWSPQLQRHVEQCQLCSDLLLVESFLQREAAAARRAATVPEPDVLWWQARLAGRRRASQRATRPIAWLERTALASAAAVAVAVAIWSWPVLYDWLQGLAAVCRQLPGMLTDLQEGSTLVLVTAAGLLLFLFGLYWEWAEG